VLPVDYQSNCHVTKPDSPFTLNISIMILPDMENTAQRLKRYVVVLCLLRGSVNHEGYYIALALFTSG